MNPAATPSPTTPTAAEERAPRQWPWIVAVALFAAWLTYVIYAARGDNVLAEATLPDGTILRLEQVTFGPEQTLVVQRGSHPVMNLLGISPKPEISASANMGEHFPRCGVWLTRRDPETGDPLDLDWFSHCIAVDEDGWEHNSGFAGRCRWSNPPSSQFQETLFRDKAPFAALPPGKYQEIVVGAFLPLFNPADGRFPLKVFNTQGEVVAELDVPYPTDPPAPAGWSAAPLPATQSTGDLEVTLERIDWTPQPADAAIEEKRLPTLKLEPQVSFRWQGEPSDDWKFISENIMAVEDGLGNFSYLDRCRLTPHVPAWKLGFFLIRRPEGRYEPYEEWDPGPIELPAAGESRELDLVGEIKGNPVRILRVCAAGNHTFTLASPKCMGAITPPLAQEGTGWKASAVHRPGFVDWTVESQQPFVVWDLSIEMRNREAYLSRVFDGSAQIEVDEVHDYSYSNNAVLAILKSPPTAASIRLKPTIYATRSVYFLIEPHRGEAAHGETASDVQSGL